MNFLTALRAEVTMRDVDLRIARKHCDEAAARLMTPADKLAYMRCAAWVADCRRKSERAHAALIEFTS
jgi:hypothetical protein